MWKLIITDDQGQQTVVNLVRNEYRIGRSEDNAIRLTERNISRKHAVLRRSGSSFSIQDLGSDNGVFVNGVRIHGQQALGHRDFIQLGDYRVEVLDEALDTQEQSHSPYPTGSTIPPSSRLPHRLVVLIGPEQGAEYALEGDRYLIGRDDDCDFRIDHGSVSRIHAEVRRLDEEHFEIIDKGSANGLRINGHERPRAVLDGRDVVELGDVVLKYIMKGQVFHVDAAEGERIAAMSGSSLPPPASEARLPLGVPLIAAAAGALLILIVLFLLFRGMPGSTSSNETIPAQEEARELTLVDSALGTAVRLHQKGDVFRAHEEARQLAESHPELKNTPEFIAIESAWAEAMMRSAMEEQDPKRQRRLLREVSQADTVSAHQRQAAMVALMKVDAKKSPVDTSDDTPATEDSPRDDLQPTTKAETDGTPSPVRKSRRVIE